jgi:hypothetical protein
MIIESIILIIFVCSLGGALLILIKKIPAVSSLPQNGTSGIKKYRFISNTENKIKEILISFEKQIFFHKILSWIKCLTLKFETKIDKLLHKIRKKAQQIDKEIKNKK